MRNLNAETIEEYFEELVQHHNGLFGVSKKANIEKIDYTKNYNRIFSFIDTLKKIDEDMDNDFLDIILHDIIKLLQQRSISQNNSQKIELGYIQFTRKYNAPIEKNDLHREFIQILNKYKPLLDSLLNTKFFYLDKYICYKISESKKIQYFLGTKHIVNIKTIMDYVQQDSSNSFMKLDYSYFGIDTVYPYDEAQLNFIKSLAKSEAQEEDDHGIEQLIKYKSHIPFFDGLDDLDIKDLITDVKFKQYKKNEAVIIERDTTLDIFFLVSGECRIMLKGEQIGLIPAQTIFGEFAFITKEKRSATIKPTRESVIISFNFDLYSFENNPCIYSKLYNNISNLLVKKLTAQNVEKS